MPAVTNTQIKTRKNNKQKKVILNANVINILYEITIKTLHLMYNVQCFSPNPFGFLLEITADGFASVIGGRMS